MRTFKFRTTQKKIFFDGQLVITTVRLHENWEDVIYYIDYKKSFESENEESRLETKIESVDIKI